MKTDKGNRRTPLRAGAADPAAEPEHADRRLFREAMRDVKPLAAPAGIPQGPKPRPRARLRRLDEAAVLAESLRPGSGDHSIENGEVISFRRNGVPERVLKKLRQGQHRVEAQIDLHGMNVTQARQALRDFLQSMQRERVRCIRIIHGKGRRSGNQGPVIKPAVQEVLQKVDAVMAYVSARPADGGTGAMYVLLQW